MIDNWLFFRDNAIFIIYVDDVVFALPYQTKINKVITDLNDANFNFEDEVALYDYLGINIQMPPDGNINLFQTLLVDHIIRDAQPPQYKLTMSMPFS